MIVLTGPKRVLQDQARSVRYRFLREDLGADRQNLLDGGQAEMLDQELDVVGIPSPGREDLHRQHVLRRRSRDPQPRVIENTGSGRVARRRNVGTRLLVEPPARQTQLGRHRPGLVQHDAVRLEDGINVPLERRAS